MRAKRQFLAALSLAVVLPASLLAQRYNFKFYGEEQGLQNLAVQVLLQDNDGFLWAGTQNGLFRYDGRQFIAYDRGRELPSSRIEALHVTRGGVLWVGTAVGLAKLHGNHFERVPIPGVRGISGRSGIASDDAGLYLATERGLVVGHAIGDREYTFELVVNAAPGRAAAVHGVYADPAKEGSAWYGCGRQICMFRQGVVKTFSTEAGVPDDEWSSFLRDREGVLWARGVRTLARLDAGGTHFTMREGAAPANSTAPILAQDQQGRLLMSCDRGLGRLSGKRWEYTSAGEGLTSNDVSSIIQDREGSVWVGLLGSGVARWLGYNEWENWSTGEGLSRESVWSISRDKAGRIWAGTQSGLNLAVMRDGRWTWQQKAIPGLETIRALAAADDGGLWIGGDRGGLARSDPVSGAVRTFGPAAGLTAHSILHLNFTRDKRLWISSRQGLFRSVEPLTGSGTSIRFERMNPPQEDAGTETFYTTVQDATGTIWAAGGQGLARYEGGAWIRYTQADGLRSGQAAYLAVGSDGAIWLGYREAAGLSRITRDKGLKITLEHFDRSRGLHSDKSIFLGTDASGQIWAGTDRGVDVYDGKRWRHFGSADGLIWDDCNANAFLADPDNSIWIGTSRGISRYQPSERHDAGIPPPVVITSARLGEQQLNPSQPASVSHRDESLFVTFAALTYVQESAVRFRYRLGDVNSEWVETTLHELNYPRLPPGKYTLEVIACNAHGIWSTEPARMQFEIRSPWWQTWWFRTFMVVAMIMFALLLWRRRLSRMEEERVRLERAVMDRTRELSLEKARVLEEKLRAEEQHHEIERLLEEAQQASRLKSEFLANMSHEIRTPMNGVLGMTDLVLATDLNSDQREHLQAARTSADSLLSLLNDILDFSKVEAGRLDLDPIGFSIHDTVAAACKTLSLKAAEKKLQLTYLVQEDIPPVVVGDPVRIHQVLLNLIGNAIKFTHEGEVRVQVRKEDDPVDLVLLFSVSDSGIGIPEAKQQIIFDAFRQADGSTTRKYGGTGLGLAICRRLVDMMGGRIWVESNQGLGSTFHFSARFGVPLPGAPQKADFERDLRSMLSAVEQHNHPLYRILLAEDNAVNQLLATRLLERRGHTVRIAGNGREAIEILEHESFDVILMDVQMPEMDGLEATAMIRTREHGSVTRMPIVAMTAHAMKGDREKCMAAGMDAYVNKPLDAVTFIMTVESMAGMRWEAMEPSG